MKILVKEDKSISACTERLHNLFKAKTSYEISLTLNGYTIIPIRSSIKDMEEENPRFCDMTGASDSENR